MEKQLKLFKTPRIFDVACDVIVAESWEDAIELYKSLHGGLDPRHSCEGMYEMDLDSVFNDAGVSARDQIANVDEFPHFLGFCLDV
jgi:hypothetical protein